MFDVPDVPALRESTPVPGSWSPVDLSGIIQGLISGQINPPRHDIGRVEGGGALLTLGTVSAVVGDSSSGKTWTALKTIHEVLSDGHRAVMIDLEADPVGVAARLLELGATVDELTRFVYVNPSDPYDEDARAEVLALVDALGPRLVCIDSTGQALGSSGLDGNADGDVVAWFAALPDPIARKGPAVLLIDHIAKAQPGDKRKRTPIGSQRKLSALTGAAYAQEITDPFAIGQAGAARLTCLKDRAGAYANGQHVADLTVHPSPRPRPYPDANPVDVALIAPSPAETFRPTRLMERVSQALEAAGGPLSTNAICDAVEGRKNTIAAALRALTSDGYISIESGPRGATLHHLIRPYEMAHGGDAEDDFIYADPDQFPA